MNAYLTVSQCPHGTLNSAPDQGLTIEEFDCACRLTQTTKPGPKNDAYLMMWRGKAVGMRLGKCVRGEELWQCGWTFKPDIPSGGLNIEFVMGYDDNILIFNATRIGQLVEKTDTH